MKKVILAISLSIAFCCCEEPLAMDNIYCYLFYNYSNKEIVLFGDYIPTDSVPDRITNYVYEFDDSKDEHELRDKNFNDKKFKKIEAGDTLSIFIIDKEVYKNNNWQTIRDSNLINERLLIHKDSPRELYYYGKK